MLRLRATVVRPRIGWRGKPMALTAQSTHAGILLVPTT